MQVEFVDRDAEIVRVRDDGAERAARLRRYR